MNRLSIYEKIKDCIEKNGAVPENFELEEREYKEDELRFAPGAMEGILGHHVSGSSDGSELAEKIQGYLQISPADALEIFEREEVTSGRVASARRGIGKIILENYEEYDAESVYDLALYFTIHGTKCESVKLGLSLLTLFETGDNVKSRQLLRILGSCEEFTDYVLGAAGSWSEYDRQNLYFELAQKLYGWGKINAVERMAADTEEKRQWILCYGCKNSVMNAYLGYICAEKCNFSGRLKQGNLTEEEFQGAREIMEGLLDEGPCEGLSAMDNPVELALLYLEECGKHALDVDLVVQLADVREYFNDDWDETGDAEVVEAIGPSFRMQVSAKVETILSGINLQAFVAENMKDNPHQCIRIAKAFELDVTDNLIGLMESDFAKYYQFCYYLFEKENYVDEFFAICEREIRESDYPNEMGNSWGFGARERKGIMLDVIVQYLDKYPLCGKKMVRICLQSPITRWRNMAGKALLGWVKELGGTLEDIDKDLYAVVEDVASRECNEGTKEKWKVLLAGK